MDVNQIRSSLESEDSRLSAIRDDIRAGDELGTSDVLSSGGELSNIDQHPADSASNELQRSIDLSMLERVEAELADVEHALAKLADGTYGACEACGEQIGEERLETLPATRYCVKDQALVEDEHRV